MPFTVWHQDNNNQFWRRIILSTWKILSSSSLLETTMSPTFRMKLTVEDSLNYSVQIMKVAYLEYKRAILWHIHGYISRPSCNYQEPEIWTGQLCRNAYSSYSEFLIPQVARFRRRPDTVPQTGVGPGVPTHSGFYIPLQAQTTAGSRLTYLWRRLNVPLNSFTRHCSPPLHRLWW